ncbi:MAG: molybdenum cofactor biosynthesis protein MoaE [Phycisphaerae bacterium]|nr:molybdenum cofactor biosynthesis protein MoaE [Phycisphaerae bacterium]
MMIAAIIVDGPLAPEVEERALAAHSAERAALLRSGSVGATVRFEGIVRRDESDPDHPGVARGLIALDYQTYDPMAQRELECLARSVGVRHGLESVVALHSRGRVGVGEVSFVLEIRSSRRAEAMAAMADFIDRLKRDVPIWKRPVWA